LCDLINQFKVDHPKDKNDSKDLWHSKMVLEAYDNLNQILEGLRHLYKPLALFRRLSVALRSLWQIQIGPTGL